MHCGRGPTVVEQERDLETAGHNPIAAYNRAEEQQLNRIFWEVNEMYWNLACSGLLIGMGVHSLKYFQM